MNRDELRKSIDLLRAVKSHVNFDTGPAAELLEILTRPAGTRSALQGLAENHGILLRLARLLQYDRQHRDAVGKLIRDLEFRDIDYFFRLKRFQFFELWTEAFGREPTTPFPSEVPVGGELMRRLLKYDFQVIGMPGRTDFFWGSQESPNWKTADYEPESRFGMRPLSEVIERSPYPTEPHFVAVERCSSHGQFTLTEKPWRTPPTALVPREELVIRRRRVADALQIPEAAIRLPSLNDLELLWKCGSTLDSGYHRMETWCSCPAGEVTAQSHVVRLRGTTVQLVDCDAETGFFFVIDLAKCDC